jgi:hypothetical protein
MRLFSEGLKGIIGEMPNIVKVFSVSRVFNEGYAEKAEQAKYELLRKDLEHDSQCRNLSIGMYRAVMNLPGKSEKGRQNYYCRQDLYCNCPLYIP